MQCAVHGFSRSASSRRTTAAVDYARTNLALTPASFTPPVFSSMASPSFASSVAGSAMLTDMYLVLLVYRIWTGSMACVPLLSDATLPLSTIYTCNTHVYDDSVKEINHYLGIRHQVIPMSTSDLPSTPATGSGNSSSSSMTVVDTTAAPGRAAIAASSPFVFGTPSAPSTFAPLFSTTAPISTAPPPPPAGYQPRHPIFHDSIQNHIKFQLNPDDHNYHKWKSFFLLVLRRYSVTHFIEKPLPPNADAHLCELDAHLVLWIYSTLVDPLIDHVVGATTTLNLWGRIRDYFLANHAARYMTLNHQYRNLKQGDLSVAEYARRMKLLTAGLADIDYRALRWISPLSTSTASTNGSTPSASFSATRCLSRRLRQSSLGSNLPKRISPNGRPTIAPPSSPSPVAPPRLLHSTSC
ncbi:hypothetical protein D1007_61151 [Hordeum vulgare]|nr:hypothetical protein D1007_61151 [Hordeum vulgare]